MSQTEINKGKETLYAIWIAISVFCLKEYGSKLGKYGK
jgi:hypothetical protein